MVHWESVLLGILDISASAVVSSMTKSCAKWRKMGMWHTQRTMNQDPWQDYLEVNADLHETKVMGVPKQHLQDGWCTCNGHAIERHCLEPQRNEIHDRKIVHWDEIFAQPNQERHLFTQQTWQEDSSGVMMHLKTRKRTRNRRESERGTMTWVSVH